jgi:hypothetical protein
LRNYGKPNERGQKEQQYKYARGTTSIVFYWFVGVLSSNVRTFVTSDSMDLS